MTFCRSQTVEEDGLVSPHTAPPHPSPAVPLPTPAGDQHPPNFFQNFQPDKTDLSIFWSQCNLLCQYSDFLTQRFNGGLKKQDKQ